MFIELKKIAKKILYSIPSSAILIFHHISDNPPVCKSGCKLSYDKFTGLLEGFDNYATLTEVVEKPSERHIAVTFDDGLKDVYETAYPFLKERNIPFTVFIVTDFLDTEGYITTENLKELAADGLVTIGSHGVTHKNLNSLSAEEQKAELTESKRIIESIIGKPISNFAFSHGQYDKNTLDFMGTYEYGFTVNACPLNFITVRNPKLVPRINVDNGSFDNAKQRLSKIFKGKSNENTSFKK